MRASEIISLKVSDIDSARMVFRVAQDGWLLLPAKHQLSQNRVSSHGGPMVRIHLPPAVSPVRT